MFCKPVSQLSYFLAVGGACLTCALQRNNKTYERFSILVYGFSLSSPCCFIFSKDINKTTATTRIRRVAWFWWSRWIFAVAKPKLPDNWSRSRNKLFPKMFSFFFNLKKKLKPNIENWHGTWKWTHVSVWFDHILHRWHHLCVWKWWFMTINFTIFFNCSTK